MSLLLDEKIESAFPDVCVNKGLAGKAGLSSRALPAFVSDWLVSRYRTKDGIDSGSISKFVARHLPDKQQKESLLYELRNGNKLKILDSYSVSVHPATGELVLRIPALDITTARVTEEIVDSNPLLLMGNVWGSGTLVWRPKPGVAGKFEIVMTEFRPMQASAIDFDYFISQRSRFDLEEWVALLIGSMGYADTKYTERQKCLLLTRSLSEKWH